MRALPLLAVNILLFTLAALSPSHGLSVRGKSETLTGAALLAPMHPGPTAADVKCNPLVPPDGIAPSALSFTFIPGGELPLSVTNFVFDVRAFGFANLQLADAKTSSRNMYQISLSTVSKDAKIQEGRPGSLTDRATGALSPTGTTAAFHCGSANTFWVSWAQGVIAFGRGDVVGRNMVVSYRDPSPISVKFIALSAGMMGGAPGCTGWSQPQCASGDTFASVNGYYYLPASTSVLNGPLFTSAKQNTYHMVPLPQNATAAKAVTFSVQTGSEAYILLATNAQASGTVFEVIMTSDKYTIRKNRSTNTLNNRVCMTFGNNLSSTELRPFWVRWANGRVTFGEGEQPGLLESGIYLDPSVPAFTFAGFMTGANGQDATWGPGFSVTAELQYAKAPTMSTKTTSRPSSGSGN